MEHTPARSVSPGRAEVISVVKVVNVLTFVLGMSILAPAHAEVAEQADAHDSNSCSYGSVGSIPTFGIILLIRRIEKRETNGLAFFDSIRASFQTENRTLILFI